MVVSLINVAELFQRRPRPPGLRLYDLGIGDLFIVRPQSRDHGVVRYPCLSVAPGIIYTIVSLKCCYVGVRRADDPSSAIHYPASFLRVDPVEMSNA